MTKQQEFLNFWDYLTNEVAGPIDVPESVKAYVDALRDKEEIEKPLFTERGQAILEYLQNQPKDSMYKAREIAEGIGVLSKAVSGAMRKLVTDGYVEKVGKDPVIYTITEKGYQVKFEGEHEE